MDDESFGELLVQQGVSSRERIRECIALRNRMAEAGVSPLPSLVDLLAQKGYISLATQQATMKFEATVRASTRPAHSGPAVGGPAMPPEAVQAAVDPANLSGKYVRVKRVGVGGMGEVWRAWDKALGRWVALKVMKYDDPGELERFRREAQTAAKLSHPNIGAIYEAQDAWIAMQFVNGQNLATFPRDDQRQLVGLIRDAALALQHAHEKDVIHRDLKPHNLMVEGSGKSWRLYVMDFGLAKQAKAESSLSAAGSVLGTPAYMPPEQARGRIHEVDARSDVYSLGATLYELLCSRTPFVSKDVYDLLKRVIEDDPQPLRQVNRRIDEDLETIVMKCLEKDPARRYGTMQELADELNRWLDGEAIRAHPPSAAYRLRKFLGRRKGLVAAVASTSVLALAAWLILGAVSRGREFDRQKADAERAFGEKRWVDARTAAARALELKEDAALVTLVADATGRAKAEETEKQKKIAEGKAFRALQDRLKPVESLINETRPFFYIQSIDIRAKLDVVEKALAEIEKIVRTPEYAGYAEPWLLLGMGWYFAGDVDRAEEALLKAESLNPEEGRTHFYLAKVYLERMEAVVNLQALALDDAGARDFEAVRALAQKIAPHARRAAEGWVGAEPVDRHLATIYDAMGRENANVRQLCNEGMQRYPRALGSEEFPRLLAGITSVGGPQEAIPLLDDVLRRRPHYDQALYSRAVWKYVAKDMEGSLADFRRVLEINPRMAYAHIGVSAALDVRKDYEGAILAIDKFIEAQPKSLEGYVSRALYRHHKGETAAAIEDCSRGLEIDPKSWRCLVQRGMIRGKRDLAGALADYTRAIEIKPDAYPVYAARGRFLGLRGDLDKAVSDLDKAIDLGDRRARTYSFRGLMKLSKGDFKGALPDFEEALRADPDDVTALEGRGAVRQDKGDLDGALADLERAVRVAPSQQDAWLNLGKIRMDKRDFAGAIADVTRAIELDPKDADAWATRGRARCAQKDEAGGIVDLRKAIELSKDDPEFRKPLEEWINKVRPPKK